MSTDRVGTGAFARSAERSEAATTTNLAGAITRLIVYNLRMSSQPRKPPAVNDWQIQEIHTAIKEADAGDFATDAEVKAVMDKWSLDTD